MTPNEKYLPDEKDNSPVDLWVDQINDRKLDAAAYKSVHGTNSLDVDINSKEFMDECFKEAPYCEEILDFFAERNQEVLDEESLKPYYNNMLKEMGDGYIDNLIED